MSDGRPAGETTKAAEPDRRRRVPLLVLAPILAVIALLAWAFASPVGSSPDDDFHLPSIWCGVGERPGLCEETGDPSTRSVPAEVAAASECYRHEPETSAACAEDLSGGAAAELVETDRGNFQNNYPPVYYAVMSPFASVEVEASVIAIRTVNIVLFVGIASFLYVLLPAPRRSTLLLAWLAGSVPLGVFLIASTNPSAWAIISGGSLWLALLAYFESTGWRRIASGVLAAALLVMAAGARGDAAVYSVIASAVVVLLTMRRDRGYWLRALLPIGMTVVAVLMYFSSAQSGVSTTGVGDGTTPQEEKPSAASVLLHNLQNVPSLWEGVFGSWSLGWFDTPMPHVVSTGAFAVAAALVFAGLRSQSWRKTVALAGVGLALVAFPIYILQQSLDLVGVNVQPRYLLPLIIVFIGVALLQVDSHRLRFSDVQLVVVGAVLALAFAAALHADIRRYTSGVGNGGWNLDADADWWWSSAPAPMAIWIVGSLAFAGLVTLVLLEVRRQTRPVVVAAPGQ
ncbi:MAG: hypothetical protein K0S05_593 [Agromyces sp.]|jgi:hypothetical protein|nr:hypothetical protein [Agromyces sp.]